MKKKNKNRNLDIVNINDLNSLKLLFDKYHYLSEHELSNYLGITIYKLRSLKRKCGIRAKIKPRKHNLHEDKLFKDSKEWFENAYKKYGLIKVSIMAGKPYNWKYVVKKLKQYNIERKSFKQRHIGITNPCFDEHWLHFYYSDRITYLKWCKENNIKPSIHGGQCLTMQQCAELAGVSRRTISNWLTKLCMEIRKNHETTHICNKHVDTNRKILQYRKKRDSFFEKYRQGKIPMQFGNTIIQNGKILARKKDNNKITD